MSDENGKNDTRDMLEKIDEQLQKHRQALEKAEQNLRRAQEKIRSCKKSMSDIQRMRSAIIGEKVVALGFDTVQNSNASMNLHGREKRNTILSGKRCYRKSMPKMNIERGR
mgnify:CR=1 FL=1